jgi:hypothetical protein
VNSDRHFSTKIHQPQGSNLKLQLLDEDRHSILPLDLVSPQIAVASGHLLLAHELCENAGVTPS